VALDALPACAGIRDPAGTSGDDIATSSNPANWRPSHLALISNVELVFLRTASGEIVQVISTDQGNETPKQDTPGEQVSDRQAG